MKKLFLILLTVAFINSINAQDSKPQQEYKSLLGDDVVHGGYGSFSVGYTQIGNYNAFIGGMKGAWIINHSIGIGIAGSGFITERLPQIIPNENYSFISGGYGGFLIEPTFYPMEQVHFSVPIIIGGGAAVFVNDRYFDDLHYYSENFDEFFVFEPGIEVELNIVNFFRVALGVSYRITSDINLTTDITDKTIIILDKKDLNKLVVKLNFKFGKF